jgi:alpha-glucan,water dikinase
MLLLLLLLLQAPGSSRDLLLLDIALESWLRLLIERQDKRSLSGDDMVELMGLVLGNAALTVSNLVMLQKGGAC